MLGGTLGYVQSRVARGAKAFHVTRDRRFIAQNSGNVVSRAPLFRLVMMKRRNRFLLLQGTFKIVDLPFPLTADIVPIQSRAHTS